MIVSSWAKQMQSTPSHPNLSRFNLILSQYLRIFLRNSLVTWGFQIRPLCIFLILFMRAACHAHLTFLDLNVLIVSAEVCKLWRMQLCNFLQFPLTPLRLRYALQLIILKYPHSDPLVQETKFHTNANNR
jgi:hypothetical protein